MTVKVRFAPSPTGRLHVGNARTALINQLFARACDGRFVLRIDDTDVERSKKEYEDGIEADLAWLGFHIDQRMRQSERFAQYDAAVAALKEADLLYPCYETGEELERKRKLQRAQGLPPVYDRAALSLTKKHIAELEAEGRKPHWRFKLSHERVEWDDLVRGPSHIETASISDPILVRADGSYLYTLPSCVDDAELKITHVVRGEDHVTNSGAQIEVFRAIGAEPPAFAHTPLLVGADGDKLSKRLGSLAIGDFRERGVEPMALNSLLAKIGTSDAVEIRAEMADLAGEFEFAKIGRAPARFDEADLMRLNAALLSETPFEAVAGRLEAAGIGGGAAFWDAVRQNIGVVTSDASDDENAPETALDWWKVVEGPITPVIEDQDFAAAAADLAPDGPYDADSWSEFTAAVKETTGAKGKKLFQPLRLALTGRARGPEMAVLFPLIGPEKTRRRLRGETV